MSDDTVVAIDTPLQFSCRGMPGLDLPPTRFVSMECNAALVTAIQSSPHLDYLARAPVLALLETLKPRIAAAGWQVDRTERPVPGAAELALDLRDPKRLDDTWWFVAIYRNGGALLYVKLRRAHRAGRVGPNDLFLLTLQWRNDALLDRAVELAKRLRVEDGLGRNDDRPIDIEVYSKRVRTLVARPCPQRGC